MKHCIQSTTIDRQGQAALGDCRAGAMAAGLGESRGVALHAAQRIAARCAALLLEATRTMLDPVPNYFAGMTRGLRVGVDSARCCCNPLWVT
jgi:hypothetical protein